ncbi:PDZ domain-containing protein [Halalkalibacter urbisdiaboli]|uniref:PDZ domain-containing protein n=1 Tax=Halalkalibacter urbisdiaboli TaxID=1960589 RepID=UPI000B44FDC1|nr:PDZ domain-containing protein [Halalkalibacter urbisdiaboli]
MTIDILKTIVLSIGSFFAHPLLYIGLIVIFLMAGRRVKRERASFHTRVYGRIADLVIPFWPSIITGVIVSIVTIALGLVFTLPMLIVICLAYIVTFLTAQVRWMSPAFALGAVLLVLAFKPFGGFLDEYGVFSTLYLDAVQIPLYYVAVLIALLVIAEGVLIQKNGSIYTSPHIQRSKRGKWVGLHDVRRLWIVPVCLFIPEGIIPSFSYWPVFSLGETSFQPLIVPFLIGFQQSVRSTLPQQHIRLMGQRVVVLGLVLALLAVVSYFEPYVAVILGAIAIIFRELLWVLAKHLDEARPSYFAVRPTGCVVLGIIPGSPAEKMEIKVGETIVKVNGQPVKDETSFYEALQRNSAFCKLDVLDEAGEVRFAQGALYDGEHHQLGVLVVRQDIELQDSVI